MKPRICLRHGIWSCVGKVPARDGWFILLMGHGYTPAEAYAEWKAQQ